MKLKEINRTAVQAWSPAQQHPVYLATGTSAQQLDASFSTTASLEIFQLDLADPGLEMKTSGTFSSPHRYHKLVWGPNGIGSDEHPSGVLIAGSENGDVILYDPAKIIGGNSDVVIDQSSKHTGPVRALDVNSFQTNLFVSGGNESEIYIWDLNSFSTPMTPGPKTQPLEDVSCVAWNCQVQHILASASPSGRASIWDLRKNDLIIKVSDHSNRMHCSGLAWNPEVATQLVLASEDDRMPVIQMWDLRFATSPLKVLENHTRGVLALAWSLADPELLLSCGKDNRILCWNPNTAEVLYELPTSTQWCFDIQWCPRNPAVLSAAAFDGHISVYSIMGGKNDAVNLKQEDQISTSFGNMDPFGTGQVLPPLQLPQAPATNTTVTPLKKPPKWIRRPVGASFAFGGKLVSLENGKPSTQPSQQPLQRVVHVSQVVTETAFLERSAQLQATLSDGSFAEFCQVKVEAAPSEFEKAVWSFLKINFEDDSRGKYLELLGYKKEELALKIAEALEKKDSQPAEAVPEPLEFPDAQPEPEPELEPHTQAEPVPLLKAPPEATPDFPADSFSISQPVILHQLHHPEVSQTEPAVNLNFVPEPQPELIPQPQVEPEILPELEAQVEPKSEMEYVPEPEVKLTPESLPEPQADLIPEPQLELVPNDQPEEHSSGTQPPEAGSLEPTPEAGSLEPTPEAAPLEPFLQAAPLEPFLQAAPLEPFPEAAPLEPFHEAAPLELSPEAITLDPSSEPIYLDPYPAATLLLEPEAMTPVDLQDYVPTLAPPYDLLQPVSLFAPPVDFQPSLPLFAPSVSSLTPADQQPPEDIGLMTPHDPASTEAVPLTASSFDMAPWLDVPTSQVDLVSSAELHLPPVAQLPGNEWIPQDDQPPVLDAVPNLFLPSVPEPIPAVGISPVPQPEPVVGLLPLPEPVPAVGIPLVPECIPAVDLSAPPEVPVGYSPLVPMQPMPTFTHGAAPQQLSQVCDLSGPAEGAPKPPVMQAPAPEPVVDLLGDTQGPVVPTFSEVEQAPQEAVEEAEPELEEEAGLEPELEAPVEPEMEEEEAEDLVEEPIEDPTEGTTTEPTESLEEPSAEPEVAAGPSAPAPSATEPVTLKVSKDLDGLITQALLTGDFESAVELCLHDNRMADSIILAIAGGPELLEKTQKKYFLKSQTKITKLISAVVMSDWLDILQTCDLHNWREALAAVMTYAKPEDFSSLCSLLGSRLEQAVDSSLQAQACLCYICAGSLEKLVSCWTKAQESVCPLSLQDLVEKVVILRQAVERSHGAEASAVGTMLAQKMSQYASLLASQGSLETALTYLPENTNQEVVEHLRERLTRALGRQTAIVSAPQVAAATPQAPSAHPAPTNMPTATPAYAFNQHSAQSVPAPARTLAATTPQYYQPVGSASTVTSWSNQTPTALPSAPRPLGPVPEPQTDPSVPPFGLHSPASAAPPASCPPGYMQSQQYPQKPQNGWNDPPNLVRGPKKKKVLNNYTPPAPITAPIMSPLGEPQAPAAPTQPPQPGLQAPYNPHMRPTMAPGAGPPTMQRMNVEGAPGAPTGDIIQPVQTLPAEKITKKPIPEEHMVLKITFEGLIQKCLAAASDPQTKRKLDVANKRLEMLYDKLREQSLSPAIMGGLHNMARSIESRAYAEGLNIHTHIVTSSNFSEISGFMPVLKAVLTEANKLGV